MNADKALELARLAYPNDENLRVAYMLGLVAGAEWQAEQLLKSSPLPEDTVLFQKGVEEGKEQMMSKAVEADVNIYRDLAAGKSWAEFVVEMPTNNLGDKVRIIICKKED